MTSKPKGKAYKVIKSDAYYKNGKPVKAGTKLNLPKAEAAKLLHRGIIEGVT